jgi:hypothetical protein
MNFEQLLKIINTSQKCETSCNGLELNIFIAYYFYITQMRSHSDLTKIKGKLQQKWKNEDPTLAYFYPI